MSWNIISSSVAGTKHIDQGKSCQDSAAYKLLRDGETLVAVVADGMGSAKYSAQGAELAVKTAITHLERTLLGFDSKDACKWKEFFSSMVEVVRKMLEQKALSCNYKVDDFACTLLAIVTTPNWLAATQIGDGLIVVRKLNEKSYRLLFPPEKGQYANETTSITSSQALDSMNVDFYPSAYQFICLATDGIERICLDRSQKNWKPFQRFFSPLEQHLLSNNNLRQEELELELSRFLRSDKINNETSDDKTLLICLNNSSIH